MSVVKSKSGFKSSLLPLVDHNPSHVTSQQLNAYSTTECTPVSLRINTMSPSLSIHPIHSIYRISLCTIIYKQLMWKTNKKHASIYLVLLMGLVVIDQSIGRSIMRSDMSFLAQFRKNGFGKLFTKFHTPLIK